jgi:hypothetical protein
MTIKLIFNITLTILIIYIFFIYSVENVENTTSGQTNTSFTDQQKIDIKNIINELYMTDVDAIRNLSDVATKLQTQNKLILPGQLNVQGKLATNNLDPLNMPTGWTGGIRFIDGYSSGNMGFGPDATTINAQINKDGNINGKKLTFIDGNVSGNMVFGPNATTINAQIDKNGNITGNNLISKGNLRLLNGGNLNVDNGSIGIVSSTDNPVHLKLINTLKLGNDQALQWSISNMNSNGTIKNDNKLSFSRTPANNISTYTPSLELYDSGDVNIPGNLTVNNIITKKNRARFIRVGNMISTDIITEADFKNIGPNLIIPSNTTTPTAIINLPNNTGAGISIPIFNSPLEKAKYDFDQANYNAKLAKENLIKANFAAFTASMANALKAATATVTNSSLAIDNWTLIEIRVFDDTGKNIALGKNVIWKSGTRYKGFDGSFLYNPTNITNGKISIINEYDTTYLGDMVLNGYQGEGKNPLHQLEIDLEGEYNISQIQLFNTRIPSFTKRMNDTIVELITGDINKPETLILNRRINTGLWDGIYSKEFIL